MNRDIPVDLRVSLLRDRPNKTFTLSSKSKSAIQRVKDHAMHL